VPIDDLVVGISHFGKVESSASVVRNCWGLLNRRPGFPADRSFPIVGHIQPSGTPPLP
jgi:hypothetical protein